MEFPPRTFLSYSQITNGSSVKFEFQTRNTIARGLVGLPLTFRMDRGTFGDSNELIRMLMS